jgi:hypothetical protein
LAIIWLFIHSRDLRVLPSAPIVLIVADLSLSHLAVREQDLAKSQIIYSIQISEHTFYDATFSKKYQVYFPINRTFIHSKAVDKISPTAFKMFILLQDHAYLMRSSCIELDPNVLLTCRESVENLLSQLQQYQLLSFTKLKEIKGNKSKDKIEMVFNENPKKLATTISSEKQAVDNFLNISNSTEIQNISLTKQKEIQEIEKMLSSPNALGDDFPPALKKGKAQFISRILRSYDFSTKDFERDLTSIINESNVDEKKGPAKVDYIVARIKTKTLEMFNASR